MGFQVNDSWHSPAPAFSEIDRIRLFTEEEGHGATWHLPSFAHFDLALFQSSGIEHALLDLDGCLTPAYCHDELTDEVTAALIALESSMRTISLGTNNEQDVTTLSKRFGFTHTFQPYQEGTMLPYKPNRRYYEHILATLAVPPETVVMIGDNPHDDVWGASQLGIRTMLVDRIDPYGFFG